ncbi:hypothetical protein DMH88_16400 [Escherichia coli]|nr:hypothetical protein [Escherichia coli]
MKEPLHYERQYQCTVKSDDSGLRNAARNMSGYHRISHDFLLSLPRICIINQGFTSFMCPAGHEFTTNY